LSPDLGLSAYQNYSAKCKENGSNARFRKLDDVEPLMQLRRYCRFGLITRQIQNKYNGSLRKPLFKIGDKILRSRARLQMFVPNGRGNIGFRSELVTVASSASILKQT
jgi:hypothetical protein